ncbi:MAG: ATP-binding protein, partial [Alphaproteobacteria bacterium]|nr:ATP-binding protein [Alphaproteobacteria bacterium]
HEPMLAEGWNLHLLVPTEPARLTAALVSLLVASSLLVLFMIAAMLIQRRARLMQLLELREQARRTLEQKVEARTKDLKKSNEDLRQTQSELVQAGKMAALGQMSTALSHEFNQPLTAIRTYAENARAFLERGMEERAQDNMNRITILTERMAKLSKRLSTFARKPLDNIRHIRLLDAVQETLELLEARIEKSEVKLTHNVAEDVWYQGGQIRLQHVLMNLIANAIDAVESQSDKRIEIKAETHSETVLICVEDNGPGVDEALVQKIFDPFFTTKEVGKGVGLGLSISYNIIRDFGGTMRVEKSQLGGAAFCIELKKGNEGGEVESSQEAK